MNPSVRITPLTPHPGTIAALSRLIIETVAHGGLTGTIIYWKNLLPERRIQ